MIRIGLAVLADLPPELLGLAGCIVLLVVLVLYLSGRLRSIGQSVRRQDAGLIEAGERLASLEQFQRTLDPRQVRERDQDLVDLLRTLMAASERLRSPEDADGGRSSFELREEKVS